MRRQTVSRREPGTAARVLKQCVHQPLNRWRLVLFVGCVLLGISGQARAVEPYWEFVNGLRERGYFEMGLFYLDGLEKSDTVPDDVRVRVPFEKARLLVQQARRRSPSSQGPLLDRAQILLEKFVEAHPEHENAGDANTELAEILKSKARVEIWQSRSPRFASQKDEMRARARDLIGRAREVFQRAHDQHKKAHDSYTTFIDEQKEPEKFAEKRRHETKFIKAQLDLATCTYDEAQTHERDAEEFKSLLSKASEEFNAIHIQYRTQNGGLFARLWQGKCFEEQDEIGKALGIYNELLGHGSEQRRASTLRSLQDQTLHFRLICLNHEQRKDYQLVVLESTDWLKVAGRRARTLAGLGIRWELTQALKALSGDRTLKKPDKNKLLEEALKNAKFVNRFPGQYKEPSTFLVRELNLQLSGDAGDPKDFDTAFTLARNLLKKVEEQSAALEQERTGQKRPEVLKKLSDDRQQQLDETRTMLRLTVSLVTPETPESDAYQARFQLAYVNFLSRRNYRAAILAEFVGRHSRETDAQRALEAAYLAMAAYVQAYNDSPQAYKAADMTRLQKTADFITTNWPSADRANDARMNMGRVLTQMGDPVGAAQWYEKVPESSGDYPVARIASGRGYWAAYGEAFRNSADRPDDETLEKWMTLAEEYLRTGLTARQAQIPAGDRSPDELVAGKTALAELLVNKGAYDEAIQLLKVGPHAVVDAIQVGDDTTRPDPPHILSGEFAGYVYQLLLRGYVGTKQLPEAREVMAQLEAIVGATGGADVTEVYVELGKRLRDELEQLKQDPQRLAAVRESFELFLSDIADREDQTLGSLIWIGETYMGLGEKADDDPAVRAEYFDQASAAYEKILERAKDDSSLLDAGRADGIRILLARCRTSQGEFQVAFDLIGAILKRRPNALDVQMEAARSLQAWGEDDPKRYQQAIAGTEAKGKVSIWGWGAIANRIQANIDNGVAREGFFENEIEARIQVARCRQSFAATLNDNDAFEKELGKAEGELLAFVGVSDEIPPEQWKQLDQLYQALQKDRGVTPEPLERPKPVLQPAVAVVQDDTSENTKKTKKTSKASASKGDELERSGPLKPVLAVVFALGGAIGIFFLMNKPKKRRSYMPARVPTAPQRQQKRRREAK